MRSKFGFIGCLPRLFVPNSGLLSRHPPDDWPLCADTAARGGRRQAGTSSGGLRGTKVSDGSAFRARNVDFAFVWACLSHGYRSRASTHAGAGSGGGHSSAIRRRMSANWPATANGGIEPLRHASHRAQSRAITSCWPPDPRIHRGRLCGVTVSGHRRTEERGPARSCICRDGPSQRSRICARAAAKSRPWSRPRSLSSLVRTGRGSACAGITTVDSSALNLERDPEEPAKSCDVPGLGVSEVDFDLASLAGRYPVHGLGGGLFARRERHGRSRLAERLRVGAIDEAEAIPTPDARILEDRELSAAAGVHGGRRGSAKSS